MGDITMKEAVLISRELYGSDTLAEENLRAKCRWEHMTRTAVIIEWGDPREWESSRVKPGVR